MSEAPLCAVPEQLKHLGLHNCRFCLFFAQVLTEVMSISIGAVRRWALSTGAKAQRSCSCTCSRATCARAAWTRLSTGATAYCTLCRCCPDSPSLQLHLPSVSDPTLLCPSPALNWRQITSHGVWFPTVMPEVSFACSLCVCRACRPIFVPKIASGKLHPAAHGKDRVHDAVQELYGNQTAALFTGALSRLLTTYLQLHGFSCGMDDLLLQVGFNHWQLESIMEALARCRLEI